MIDVDVNLTFLVRSNLYEFIFNQSLHSFDYGIENFGGE